MSSISKGLSTMAILDTITFFCDFQGCHEHATFFGIIDPRDVTDAHLWLVTEKHWATGRESKMMSDRRTHFCPDHRGEAK